MNSHNVSNLKQRPLVSLFCILEAWYSVPPLAPFLSVPEGPNEDIGRAAFLSRAFGDEPAFKIVHVICQIQFLLFMELKSPFPFLG